MGRVILFHGTCEADLDIHDSMIGAGHHANSALGMHFELKPAKAAEYARDFRSDYGEAPDTPDEGVVVVSAEIEAYGVLGGLDEFLEGPERLEGAGPWDHGDFARWRSELLADGYNAVDFSDECEHHVVVLLDPERDATVIDTLDVREAERLEACLESDLGSATAGEDHPDAVLKAIQAAKAAATAEADAIPGVTAG